MQTEQRIMTRHPRLRINTDDIKQTWTPEQNAKSRKDANITEIK